MTATTVAGVGSRIGATENGVAAAVRRAMLLERDAPLPVDEAREIYRRLPDVARPAAESLAIARALLGHRGPALTCVVPLTAGEGLDAEQSGRLGLTPRADTTRLALRSVFGPQSLGGFDPDGVSTGHIEGSAHYEGRAIDVFFRPITAEGTAAGWQEAMWAVAHAEQLDIATRHLRPPDLDREPIRAGLARLPAPRRRDRQPGAAARGPRARRRPPGRLTAA